MNIDKLQTLFEQFLSQLQGNHLSQMGVTEWMLVGFVALFLLLLGGHKLANLFTTVKVCARRGLVFSRGAFERQIQSITFNRIKAVNIIKPPLGFLFNYAKVNVVSRSGSVITFHRVKNSRRIKALLDDGGTLNQAKMMQEIMYKAA